VIPPANDERTAGAKPNPSNAGAGKERTKSLMRKACHAFAAGLGVNWHKEQKPSAAGFDRGTLLAEQRTGLAIERSYLAAGRTLMAWIRTSLSMIGFGFTIGKFGPALQRITVKGVFATRSLSIVDLAYFLVVLGTVALVVAAWQYGVRVSRLCEQGLQLQFNLGFVVALLLALLGAFAFTSLVANF
jgi:putative membrane protein